MMQFTPTTEAEKIMYEALQSVDKILGDMWLGNLHTYERREIGKAWKNINAALQALATPQAATEPASEPATGLRYVVRRDLRMDSDKAYVVDRDNYSKQMGWYATEAEAQAEADRLNAGATDETEPTTWYTAEYNKRTGTFMVRETESVDPAGYDNAQSAQDECDRLNNQPKEGA